MMKRALIIEPDYGPRPWFVNSARCIDQFLRQRGFEIHRREGPDATRAGILAAYAGLTARTEASDTAVVCYVGHGMTLEIGGHSLGRELPPYLQFICPSDFAQTTEDDFRGITAAELSLQLAALTERTPNTTVILECCHAARMSRDIGAAQGRANLALTHEGLTRHLRELRQRHPRIDMLIATGNPDAVRIGAADQFGGAMSVSLPPPDVLAALGLDLPAGGWIGAMTLRLVEILSEIGERQITWRSIGEALRARVHSQRPEIEGPVDRVPFSLTTVEAAAFSVRDNPYGPGAVLDAGSVLGVSVGDVYGVMPAGSTRLDPALAIADITIDQVTAVTSIASRIDGRGGATRLPPHAVAIARSLAFPRPAVRIVCDAVHRPAVEAAVQSSARIRPATAEERHALAELRVEGQWLELHDEIGRLFPPAAYPQSLPDAIGDLENLATAHRLRILGDQGIAASETSVALLVVEGRGAHRRIADHGETLVPGTEIAVELINHTSQARYGHVFSVGLRKRISMISAPGGIKLNPERPAYCDHDATGAVVGFTLNWPKGLPRDQPRTDTVMVVITDKPQDLSALANREHLGRPLVKMSSLEALFGQLATGRPRDGHGQAASPFAIYWRDFELDPR